MKTEILKQFMWGFILSEPDAIRIFHTCKEQAIKLSGDDNGDDHVISINAKLKDGAIVESDDLHDIISLDNSGSKTVCRLIIKIRENTPTPSWLIKIDFQNGLDNSKDWTSIEVEVFSETRDKAFIAYAEIEERIKKIKKIPWPYYFNKRESILFFFMIILFGGMFIIGPILSTNRLDVIDNLEKLHDAGSIQDPIDALIYIQ